MKTIWLNTWERVRLTRLVAEQSAPTLAQVRQFLRVLNAIELGEEETGLVGLQSTQIDGGVSVNWDPAFSDHEFEITMEDATFEMLHRTFKGHTGWEVDRRLLLLEAKLLEAASDDNAE